MFEGNNLERKGNFLSLESFTPTIHSHKTVRKLLNLYITTSGQCSYIGDVATNDHSDNLMSPCIIVITRLIKSLKFSHV